MDNEKLRQIFPRSKSVYYTPLYYTIINTTTHTGHWIHRTGILVICVVIFEIFFFDNLDTTYACNIYCRYSIS